MEYILYKLDKTKIVFKNLCPIDRKLFQPTFNYQKFYAIPQFIEYIQNFKSTINYNTTYSEIAYQYLFKAIYRRINKKKYRLYILKHVICYINIITIENTIFIAKVLVKNTRKTAYY